jgi:hypothetical protein
MRSAPRGWVKSVYSDSVDRGLKPNGKRWTEWEWGMPRKTKERVTQMFAEGKDFDEIVKHIDTQPLNTETAAAVWLYAWRLGRTAGLGSGPLRPPEG